MPNGPTGLAPAPPQESQGQGSSIAEAPFGMALEWRWSQELRLSCHKDMMGQCYFLTIAYRSPHTQWAKTSCGNPNDYRDETQMIEDQWCYCRIGLGHRCHLGLPVCPGHQSPTSLNQWNIFRWYLNMIGILNSHDNYQFETSGLDFRIPGGHQHVKSVAWTYTESTIKVIPGLISHFMTGATNLAQVVCPAFSSSRRGAKIRSFTSSCLWDQKIIAM